MTTGLKVLTWLSGPPGVGTETDLSGVARYAEGVTIQRGRGTANRTGPPSTVTCRVDNADGRFTLTNPLTALTGSRVGAECAVTVTGDETHLFIPAGMLGSSTPIMYAFALDSAGLSITGDIEVTVDAWVSRWEYAELVSKYTRASDQRSYALVAGKNPLGQPCLAWAWSTAGTAASLITAWSTVPVPVSTGRLQIKVTHDVDNGAAGNTVTFFTRATSADSWVQLGDAVVTAGTTSIYNSTARAVIGQQGDGPFYLEYPNYPQYRFYSATIRQGIGGTLRANVDFTGWADGATSGSDGIQTWYVTGTGPKVRAASYRAVGELVGSTTGQDQSGTDVWADLEISGPSRRIQKDSRISSAYTRAVGSAETTFGGLVEWWPMEDPSGSTTWGSGLSGGRPATQDAAFVTAASNATDFPAALALPTIGAGRLRFPVRSHTSGEWVLLWMMRLDPAATIPDNTILVQVTCTGPIMRMVEVRWLTGGGLRVISYDATGTALTDSGAVSWAGVDRDAYRWLLSADSFGTSAVVTLGTLAPGLTTGLYTQQTSASTTIGQATGITINPRGVDLGATVIGQVTLQATTQDIFALSGALAAHAGERAVTRFKRLLDETGIPAVVCGVDAYSTVMGPQSPGTRWDQLTECETSDHGVIVDDRHQFALRLTCGHAMIHARSDVSLSRTGGDLLGGLPALDDSLIENLVTVKGVDGTGGSASADVTTGPLGSASPENGGIWPRQGDYTISVNDSSLLGGHAWWLAHEGTCQEPSWSGVSVHLGRGDVAVEAPAVRALDAGDALTITDPPAWTGPADSRRQVIVGVSETIDQVQHVVRPVVRPASLYDVGRWDDTASGMTTSGGIDSRWSPGENSFLAANATAVATTLTVYTIGWWWGHDGGDYDIRISGTEVCTVTGVGATGGATQTLTVVRSVNGVVAAAYAGMTVELDEPALWMWGE